MEPFKVCFGRFSLQMPGEGFVILLTKIVAVLLLLHF